MSIPTKKRPADANQRAKSIVDDLTGEADQPAESAKVAAGRNGGETGAAALAEAERSEIANRAAKSRWDKPRG